MWSAIERFGQQGAVFIIQVVLARILAPEQFGLIAMVGVFMILSGILVDSGFNYALIQRKEVGDKDLSTVFYFNILVSCLMTGALWLLAPLIAKFYQFEELALILRVLSLRLIIGAFGSAQGAILSRQMKFKRVFWISLPSTIVSGAGAIWMALAGFGVWALVAQALVQSVLMSSAYWLQSDWRPKLIFDLQCLKEMFPYGSRLALTTFLNRGFENIYIIVIGKCFSAADLGYFQRARSLQRLPVENIQGIIGRVAFPLFSKMQDNPARMKRGMRKALQLSSLLIFPGMALLAAIAEPLIVTLIGSKWLPAVPYLKYLCIVGALYPIHAMNVNLLLAKGCSDLTLRIGFIKKTLELVNILITYRYGIQMMIYGMVVTSICGLWINTYYTNKLIDYSFLGQVADVLPLVCIAAAVFGVNLVFAHFFELSTVLELCAGIILGGIVLLVGLRYVGASLRGELERVLSQFPLGRIVSRVLL
jgi:O-antigen/teichoic acid export membrane protein